MVLPSISDNYIGFVNLGGGQVKCDRIPRYVSFAYIRETQCPAAHGQRGHKIRIKVVPRVASVSKAGNLLSLRWSSGTTWPS